MARQTLVQKKLPHRRSWIRKNSDTPMTTEFLRIQLQVSLPLATA